VTYFIQTYKLTTTRKNLNMNDKIIAGTLLYETNHEPLWTKLTKPIKHELCKCVCMSSKLIHDPRFYETLHKVWSKRREYDITKIVEETQNTIDCAICLDTFKHNGKDKITTLLCGHTFCTPCMLKHIVQRGEQVACPMCRSCIFRPPTSQKNAPIVVDKTEEKRKKRRIQRWLKRTNKKKEKKLKI